MHIGKEYTIGTAVKVINLEKGDLKLFSSLLESHCKVYVCVLGGRGVMIIGYAMIPFSRF